MFAALIRADGDVMRLAATLNTLVEGVAAGLIGHAVVIVPEVSARAEIERLAEAVGADSVAGTVDAAADWRGAAQTARGEWLLLVKAGDSFGPGWIAAVERHAMTSAGRPGRLTGAGWTGLRERCAARLGAAAAGSGSVLPKSTLLAAKRPEPPLILPIRRVVAD